MLDRHVIPFQRRRWESNIVALLEEVICQLYIVEKGPCVNDNSLDDASYHLRGVRLLILHAERVAQDLENL
jgi:hypothetical protein